MITLAEQRKAIRLAVKEYTRELIKANESKNQEWIADVKKQIASLEAAVQSIEHLESLRKIISDLSAQ